jgi:hypothetical protein
MSQTKARQIVLNNLEYLRKLLDGEATPTDTSTFKLPFRLWRLSESA